MTLDDAVASALRDAGERAIVPRFRSLERVAITEKSPGDWVTDADHEAESLITTALTGIDPGVPVIGEEAAASDPAMVERASEHQRVWVLDPLDGTRSFIDGSPDFASMVALVEEGVATRSWIWQPIHGRLFHAVRGGGVFADGRSLDCPPQTRLPGRGVLRTRMMPPALRSAALDGFASHGLEHTPIAAAGVVYPMLLTGELTHALYWRTLPWDHAPGTLLAEELGLVVRRLDGSPVRPFDGRFGLLSAADQQVWDAVRAALPADLPADLSSG
jgi:fructose-1,6-bisphosphatase/inositol monophosphatase family enzyme